MVKRSVYDLLDVAEDELNSIDPDDRFEIDVTTAKDEVSKIDDDVRSVIEQLENVKDLHDDKELTLERLIEFFDSDLPEVIKELTGLKERLY